jgi:hypothetical protein
MANQIVAKSPDAASSGSTTTSRVVFSSCPYELPLLPMRSKMATCMEDTEDAMSSEYEAHSHLSEYLGDPIYPFLHVPSGRQSKIESIENPELICHYPAVYITPPFTAAKRGLKECQQKQCSNLVVSDERYLLVYYIAGNSLTIYISQMAFVLCLAEFVNWSAHIRI